MKHQTDTKQNRHPQTLCHRAPIVLILLVLMTLACGRTTSPTTISPQSITAAPPATFTPFPSPSRTTAATATLLPTHTLEPASPSATTTPLPVALTLTKTPQPQTPAATAAVDFIDVGQGDAILVQSAEGKTALIDGGELGAGVLDYLTAKGITHLDLMVATHPHADHIGGLVEVLGAIPVDRVVTSGQAHTTQLYERFLDGILNAEAEYIEAQRGDTIPLGSLAFQVLSPATTQPSGELNNNSVVLRLAVGQVAFLFTGDAQTEAEAGMIAAGLDLRADILKVGHHGSHTSSSPAFLAPVKPSVAVYMAGAGNSYGHPHAETIAALTAIGAQIYGTDTQGTIVVSTDGKTFQVHAAPNGPRAPPVIQAIEPTAPPVLAGPLSLEILSVSSPIQRGARATLEARSVPGATCAIVVHYKSGPSKAKGLGPKIADGAGHVSWSWNVGANTTPGTWRIGVSCQQEGQNISQETQFEVTS